MKHSQLHETRLEEIFKNSIGKISLWKVLKRKRIQQKYINILVEMYSGTSSQSRMDRKRPSFAITNGVKQSNHLSPNLLNCIIEEILWKMGWENTGIKIDGKWLSNLKLAEDVAFA